MAAAAAAAYGTHVRGLGRGSARFGTRLAYALYVTFGHAQRHLKGDATCYAQLWLLWFWSR